MTRVLIGYDGSDAARAAIAAAAAYFPAAHATVATVQPPPPSVEAGAMARVALPDAVIREGIERMRVQAEERSRGLAAEGVALAQAAGLQGRHGVTTAAPLKRPARRSVSASLADSNG